MAQLEDNYISPFGNMANTMPEPRYATDIFDTDLEKRTLMFACYKGRTSRKNPGFLFSEGVMCDVTDMPAIKGEPINEKESMAMGKKKSKTNQGQMYKTSLKLNGDAIYGLAAICDYDFSDDIDADYGMLAPSTMRIKGDYGILGIIFIHSGSYARHLRSSEVLTQCRLKVAETPGSSDSYTVEIESEGEHMKSGNGQMYVFENFVDRGDGIINNGFAPDGIQTVFKVGNGNHSLIGASTPLGRGLPLQPVRPKLKPSAIASAAVTLPFYWFVEIAIDGVEQKPKDVLSFDRATGELTFATPPAMGSCLSLVYALPTGKPDFHEEGKYSVGQVRMYNGDYYVCAVNNGPGVWNAANWTLIPAATHLVGAEYRPHNYGQDDGTTSAPAHPTCMFWSWTMLNYEM